LALYKRVGQDEYRISIRKPAQLRASRQEWATGRATIMRSTIRNILAASAAGAICLTTGMAAAADAQVGIMLGFTGPLEAIPPGMGASAELALKEANDSGLLADTLVPVRADSTCIDSAAATAAAERLVTAENVVAIMGADCSGVTTAVMNN